MSEQHYWAGIDVGSTTVKMVVTDADGRTVFSGYERHNARVGEVLAELFSRVRGQLGNAPLALTVTGSVGMRVAEQLHTEFVQEVAAATTFARQRYPGIRALIDIGGEDAKVVFFNDRNTDLRMNGNCAGGTGAFIDQMAVLMGVGHEEMSRLAMQASRLHPIAARCGVFSKTDVQNLMARNIPREEIAASIFHAIAVQTVTSLAHGADFRPQVLLCGGPLTFLPALRKAFADYLNFGPEDFVVEADSHLVPAIGCALRARQQPTRPLADWQAMLSAGGGNGLAHTAIPPLFLSEDEYAQWQREKQQYALPRAELKKGRQDIYIGIDSGSTTTKIVAVDAHGRVCFTFYESNQGQPIQTVARGLRQLDALARAAGTEVRICGGCSTGYGEDLVKVAFTLDDGIIETMAHYRAANRLMPGVTFILDIGGQDMKAIFVDHGAVVRMELNEACSSGCGTFIETFAKSLGYPVTDFARMACTAQHPCDLGTRCTVFMNSKVKQMLREGATIADISAGLSYSVVRNCLYKVLKFKQNDELGSKVVVQGGTMRNDSVVRAFERLTGTSVIRSDHPELMGAYGCALHALQHASQQQGEGRAQASQRTEQPEGRPLSALLASAAYETSHQMCRGCENRCLVSRYTFADGARFYSGNKCEKVFSNRGANSQRGQNIYPLKNQLLFGDDALTATPAASASSATSASSAPSVSSATSVSASSLRRPQTIGIPRILNMYEDFPFWRTLLEACGFRVMLSSPSTFARYEGALSHVMSDNICFPAKLVHSHIKDLERRQVDRILMPYVVYERKDDQRTDNSFNCPVVSGYSDVVRSSQNPRVPLDSPVITFADESLLRKQVCQYLKTLGVDQRRATKALRKALDAQDDYTREVKACALRIAQESRSKGRVTILLAGRPYHTDPLVQHKLSEMIAALGVDVISDDIVRHDEQTRAGDTYLVKQWAYMNRILKSAEWVAQQDSHVHFVQMTSFGCGPDAFLLDEVGDILRRHGKPFTMLKIDDVNNIGSLRLRVRSLVESLKEQGSGVGEQRPFRLTKTFSREDKQRRKLLVPFFTDYLTPIIPPILKLEGYDFEVLPLSDGESAQLGLKYANNEVCYPATLIVGDIIKALKSGRYDPDHTAVVMSQTGGQCRATNYIGLIKRAMLANGFDQVPVVSFGTDSGATHNEQEGFHLNWMKIGRIVVNALIYADIMSKFYHACVVREREKGVASRLRQKYMDALVGCIGRNDSKPLLSLIRQAALEFDAASLTVDRPRVGIVGEIFLKFNAFAHQNLSQFLIDRNIEVVPPILMPFFMQSFVNHKASRDLHLEKGGRTGNLVVAFLYRIISRSFRRYNEAASAYRYYHPFTDIYRDAARVKGLVSLAGQFGEGWLLPADVIGFIEEGVKNVVSLQPFGCIANHVISKGIERRLRQRYPDLNLLSLDFDSGVSETNVTNRLLLFIDEMTKEEREA